MTEILSSEAIVSRVDVQTEDVHVPEWGGTVRLRGLNGEERDAFEESCILTKGTGAKQTREVVIRGMRARLLVKCMVNAQGDRLFTDAQAPALLKKSGAVLARLFEIAERLSGLSKDDVEEIAGN